MKHITLNYAKGLLRTLLIKGRPPMPFPGRSTPTRVAWYIVWGSDRKLFYKPNPHYTPGGGHGPQMLKYSKCSKINTLQYAGKPNRFRAIEALQALSADTIISMWAVEFDAGGLIAFMNRTSEGESKAQSSLAYTAYHPHNAAVNIMESFSKPVYVKRIGKMSVYSHARKLSLEKLDAFYGWYEKSFGKKLKRPKQAPQEIEINPTADF